MAFWHGLQAARARGGSWVRLVEHTVLRVASLAFSLVSAHAIRWFFSPLDRVDSLMPVMTWVLAVGFGVLGYFVRRGMAHRMMNKESIWAYAPICVVVEVVEVFCNFALAASVVQGATWLRAVPTSWHGWMVILTYCVLAIIPVVSVFLAVVDMDLERRCVQGVSVGGAVPKQANPAYYPTGGASYQQGYAGNASPSVVPAARQGGRAVGAVNASQGGQATAPFVPVMR